MNFGIARSGGILMSYQTIEVRPLTPTLGAEVSGVDLSAPLSDQQFQEIHDGLMAHQVIFFRDFTANIIR